MHVDPPEFLRRQQQKARTSRATCLRITSLGNFGLPKGKLRIFGGRRGTRSKKREGRSERRITYYNYYSDPNHWLTLITPAPSVTGKLVLTVTVSPIFFLR